MSLHLQDCAPQLRARIEEQLAKDLHKYTRTEVTYALASQILGHWHFGMPTTDQKLVERAVKTMQTRTGAAAYQTSIGNPPAVCVMITTTIHASQTSQPTQTTKS